MLLAQPAKIVYVGKIVSEGTGAVMGKMDIFDFRDMFADVRSAAFVGNSSSVTSWNNGQTIDSYDMVVRFNRAYTKGLEEKIGGKTDVLVSNDINCIEMAPPPAETLKPKCVVVFVKPKRELDLSKLKEWIGDIPYVISLEPDIFGTKAACRTRSFTMGTYALYTFLRLFALEKVFLTGFTMFGNVQGGSLKYFGEDKKAGHFHDLDQEAIVFADVVKQFSGELHMTSEVESLVFKDTSCANKNKIHSLKSKFYHALSQKLLRKGFYFRRKAETDIWLYNNQNVRSFSDKK
jgi:Glycosyltransferase family 29 (sialyltransferase)